MRTTFTPIALAAAVAVALIMVGSAATDAALPTINEVMSSNISGSIMDEYNTSEYNCLGGWCDYLLRLEPFGIAQYDGDYPDWIEICNPGATMISLEGYGLSDDPGNPFKWVFPKYVLAPGDHFVVFASGKDRKPAMDIDLWNTIIRKGDEWKYRVNLAGGSAPAAGWELKVFDDSSWSAGPSGFGFGDNDDATALPWASSTPETSTVSVFLRKTFTVTDLANISSCYFNIDLDDGFVAYLNGTKIASANMAWDGVPPAYNTLATVVAEACLYRGQALQKFDITNFASLLVHGENVLAIQVHNQSMSSNDLSASPFLTFGLFDVDPASRGIDPLLEINEVEQVVYLPHTNFKLDGDSNTVVLTAPDGTTVDQVVTGEIPIDFSLGRKPDGVGEWVVFNAPTPQDVNSDTAFPGFLDTVAVSVQGGFYASAVSVALSAVSPEAEIRYTIDSNDPTTASTLYTGPITVSTSTVLKARAFRNGILSSPIVTQTYMIGYTTTMAVVSLSTPPANLYDGTKGIYTSGTDGHNYNRDMERPCHVEFFEQDGNLAFSQDAGIRLAGRSTRGEPRKSLAIMARGRYGNGTFAHQLFPGMPIDEFNSFVLRNGGNDIQGTLIRDDLAQDLVKDLDIDMIHSRPVVVFLNGQYWGIYSLHEKQNEEYIAAHHNADPTNLDFVELYRGDPPSPVVIDGSPDNYRAMVSWMETHDLSIPENYEYVKSILDINSYLDHNVTQCYYANADWLGNNYKGWRPLTSGGKWRYLMFDIDFAFDGQMMYANNGIHDYTIDMVNFLTNPAGPKSAYPPYCNLMQRRLFMNEEFRNDFINRTADYLNTIYLPENVNRRVDEYQALYEPEIQNHINKWGSSSYQGARLDSKQKWYTNLAVLKTYAAQRPTFMRQHIIQYWQLGGQAAVTLNVSDPAGGKVRISTVTPDSYPWSGTYFQDIPVQITALPNPGYTFAGWEGVPVAAKAAAWSSVLALSLEATTSLTAVFEPSADAMNAVVINEINYNSAIDFAAGDWVELYNGYETPVDLSGWRVRDDDDSRSFIFQPHTMIEPGGYLVVGEDPAAFAVLFPDVMIYHDALGFNLGNGGDSVRIYDSTDALVDVVNYDDIAPWPTDADGTGATLGLRHPLLDNADPVNWSATLPYGTPGAANVFTADPTIVINEINYNPGGERDAGDWVELYNALDEDMDLSNWVFKDGDDAHIFTIPSGTMLPAGEYLVLARELAKFAAGFPLVTDVIGDFVFGLSNGGDRLRLFDAEGALVDQVVYDDAAPWPLEPDGTGPTLALRNPLGDNNYYVSWQASSAYGTPGEQNDVYSTGVGDNTLPVAFSVGQNYPNPFNAETVIPINIPANGRVTVTVYSLLGQRVEVLADRVMPAGSHLLPFRPSGLASGIYICTVRFGSHIESRSMLYLK